MAIDNAVSTLNGVENAVIDAARQLNLLTERWDRVGDRSDLTRSMVRMRRAMAALEDVARVAGVEPPPPPPPPPAPPGQEADNMRPPAQVEQQIGWVHAALFKPFAAVGAVVTVVTFGAAIYFNSNSSTHPRRAGKSGDDSTTSRRR